MPEKLELKAGEIYTFRLKGLGAAGFNWEYDTEETGKVVSVSLELINDRKKTGPLPPGYSLDVLATIHSIEPGHATVHLIQRRSWEKNKPPLKEYVIEIIVKN